MILFLRKVYIFAVVNSDTKLKKTLKKWQHNNNQLG